jgi:hypothetical protein
LKGVKDQEIRAATLPAYLILCSWHYCFIFRFHREEADPYSYDGIPPEAWALLESNTVTLIGSDIAKDLVSLRIPNVPIVDAQVVADYMKVMHGMFLDEDKVGLSSIARGVWDINFDYKVRNVAQRARPNYQINFHTFHRKTPSTP